MNFAKEKKNITVIGGGVIGCSTAWHLSKLGHDVTIIDFHLDQTIKPTWEGELTGTQASLGVLMGYVYKRTNGRGWRLRERSMELWPNWIRELNNEDFRLKLETPLIQIATSEKEYLSMKKLTILRKGLGVELLKKESSSLIESTMPTTQWGGIKSKRDGRINPLILLNALFRSLNKNSVQKIHDYATSIKRQSSPVKRQWIIKLQSGGQHTTQNIVICAAIGCEKLIKPLGYSRLIEPVLGQAIQIQVAESQCNLSRWPPVLIRSGINLIPNGKNQLIIGATLEAGESPNQKNLDNLKTLDGTAPEWMKNSKINAQWYGIRGRPDKRYAPILEELEPGLIIASGHYRNGILLAPATAEWVSTQIS